MIFASLKSGIAHMRMHKRMLWVYYLSNLFFALLIAAPLRFLLGNFIGSSQMGERLGGAMDMDFLFEFIKENLSGLSAFTGLVLVVPAAYGLFNLFLSGGAFATFAQQEKYSAAFFWSSAARYFGRFLRLSIWSLPLLIALFCVQFLESGIRLLIFGNEAYQSITYWGGWIRTGILGASLGIFLMVLDYARIYTIFHDETQMRTSLWQALKFTARNFLPTAGLALTMFFLGGAALLLYNPIANSLNAPNGLIVFLLFLWQQAYMFFRMIVRLTLYAGETYIYENLVERTAPAEDARQTPDFGPQDLSLATE